MDGDEVRGTRFARGRTEGYAAAEVNDLLGRVAAELDAGRSAGPLIENATFRRLFGLRILTPSQYDIDAVDWFLDQLSPPSAATTPDDAGRDDAPPTDAPGQDQIPGAVDDAPPTDAPGQDQIPGAADDAPPTDAPGQDAHPGAVDDAPPTGGTERADMGADPWRDLAVAQLAQRGAGAPAKTPAVQLGALDRQFTQECYSAWQQFGRQPGVFLQEGRATGGRWWARRHELRTYARQTAEQQVIASRDSGLKSQTLRVGGRSFTYRKVRIPLGAIPAGLVAAVEIAARSARDSAGHFTAEAMSSAEQLAQRLGLGGALEQSAWASPTRAQHRMVRELVDETGMPILYTSGANFDRRACACVTFADQRWLRFLVRGTTLENAIMTAVDQAGNKVAQYRQLAEDFDLYREWGEVIITVHPDRELTDELVAAIALSAGWLESYFSSPQRTGSGVPGAPPTSG